MRRRGYIRERVLKDGEKRYRVEMTLGVDATTGKKKRHSKTFKTPTAAQVYLTAKLAEKDGKGYVAVASKGSLSAYMNQWLEIVKDRVRPRTHEDYAAIVRRYVHGSDIGYQRLAELRTIHLQVHYRKVLEDTGHPTIKKLHAVLRSALNDAVCWDEIPFNPALSVKLPKRAKKAEREILDSVDFPAFIQAALQENRLGVMWVLGLATGMRPGEYLGLKWPDFDQSLRQLTVYRTLVRPYKVKDGEPPWRFENPKTKKSSRSIPIESEMTFLLRQHRAQQNEERLAAGAAYAKHDLVFATELGEPLHYTNLAQRNFKRILERAGINPKLSPYSLRHGAATALVRARESLKIVSELLGHSSITLTADTYSHVSHDMLEGAAGVLSQAMFGAKKSV